MFTRVPALMPEMTFPSMESFVDAFLAAPRTRPGAAPFPPVNVWEDEQAIQIEAELPGYTLGDLEISTLGNELTVAGTRREARPEGVHFHRRERHAGGVAGFKRSLRIGVPIDAEKISATLTGGVLSVTLPKAEAAKPRKIEVRAA